MGGINTAEVSDVPTPAAGTGTWFLGHDGRIKIKFPDGSIQTLSDVREASLLVNGGFWLAQPQAPGTLTTYNTATDRLICADQWGITNESASVQYQRGDTETTPEVGLQARHYAKIKKITAAGKVAFSQAIIGNTSIALRGRRVGFQIKARNSVGLHTLRIGLLQLTAAGTTNAIPAAFVSAFGGAGVDPTFGANLSLVAPVKANANCSVVGSALTCVLTSSWQRFQGVWEVPADAKNLAFVIFTNGQMAIDDIVCLGEGDLFDGDEERDWKIEPESLQIHRAQRFMWKTFNLETAPATGVAIGPNVGLATNNGAVGTNKLWYAQYPVPMWSNPGSITFFNPVSANANARDLTAGADCSGTISASNTERGLYVVTVGNAATVFGNILAVHILAQAKL